MDEHTRTTNVGLEPRLISVEAAAAILGIRRTLAYALIRNGHLPSVKVGGRRLVSVADLDDFIAAHREPREETA